jgi:hypothetical protein
MIKSTARSRRYSATRADPRQLDPLRDRLLLLNHIFALLDKQVCERWVYDPPARRQAGAAVGPRVAHETGALRGPGSRHFDTTVQPLAIT